MELYDKERALDRLWVSPKMFQGMPIEWRRDRVFMLKALCRKARVFAYFEAEFKADFEIALSAVSKKPCLLEHVAKALRSKEFELAVVRLNGDALVFCEFKGDEEVAFAAVQQSGLALSMCEPFQSNPRFVRAAVSQYGTAIQYAAEALKYDEDLALIAVQRSPEAFFLLPRSVQDKLLCTALSICGDLLQRVPYEDRTYDAVLAAVKQDGMAIYFAPHHLKRNMDIVFAAVTQNGRALRALSADLRDTDAVVLAAIKEDCVAIQHASARLRDEFAFVALSLSPHSFIYLSSKFRSDKAVVKEVVSKAGHLIAYTSLELQKDPEVVLAAVSKNGLALQWAAKELKSNPTVVLAAVEQHAQAFLYCDLNHDRKIALSAVRCGKNFQHVAPALKTDPEIAMRAVANCKETFFWACEELKNGGLLGYMRALQSEHDTFMLFMLASKHRRQAAKRQCAKECVLAKLNCHGPHFALLFKKKIAAYVGAYTVGENYQLLRKATCNAVSFLRSN